MYVFKRLAERGRHLLVQVLMVPFMLSHSVSYELFSARLLYVVIKPRQVELIHAEADEVEKGLDVVDRGRVRVQIVLTHRSEHSIALEMLYLSV